MEEEKHTALFENGRSQKSKNIKKTKYGADVEADRRFDSLKRKYANAIAFLLVNNIPRLELS